MTNFKYISAPAGSGKTTAAINASREYNANGFNVMFVVPTIALANQIATQRHIHAIHSDNNSDPSVYIHKLINDFNDPITIVICEESFRRISLWTTKDQWVIFKDEATEPLTINDCSIEDSFDIINDMYNFTPIVDSTLAYIAINPDAKRKTTSYNDLLLKPLHAINQAIANPHYEVIVNTTSMASKFKAKSFTYSLLEKPTLYSGFHDVIFISANFEHTFLYHHWLAVGVNWTDVTADFNLVKIIPNTNRVKIHYFLEHNTGWSKSARDKWLGNYVNWLVQRLAKTPYVWVANNSDYEHGHLIQLNPSTHMPAICHGLNNFRSHTTFVSCASYLINDKFAPFYSHYGTSVKDARAMRNSQMLFQQLMRTDLRNYSSTKTINLYVPTCVEARELLAYLPEATVCDYDKQQPGEFTNFTATLSNRFSGVDLTAIETKSHISLEMLETDGYVIGNKITEVIPRVVTQMLGTTELIGPQSQGTNKAILVGGDCGGINIPRNFKSSGHCLIDSLRLAHKNTNITTLNSTGTVKSATDLQLAKSKNAWFSVGRIEQDQPLTKDNVKGVFNYLVFDFDDTKITRNNLSKAIFPGTEYLTYTTISNSDTKSCFRCIVPTNRPMTLAEHAIIMDYYLKKLAKTNAQHGLDPVSMRATQKFFYPHKEADLKWRKAQAYRDEVVEVLNIDRLLSTIPKAVTVAAPADSDLNIIDTTTGEIVTNTEILDRVDAIISTMTVGDRSVKATRIGGMLGKYILDSSIKHAYMQRLKQAGVGEAAMKSVRKYAKL